MGFSGGSGSRFDLGDQAMRLTLRTLLAWLDDTLPPSEVREIGRQVGESPFAKDLVERVHRVTRQRRLTVPSRTGPDATDPNLVASYLDNELAAERVAEFEKQCLTSDVHLAEVASVHQILSLIGQKAKVPNEARHRMYQLVKGRESVSHKTPRASQPEAPTPISEPIQPWVTPEPPRRPWIERFGPVAAVLALILVLCLSAWQSLSPPSRSSNAPTPAETALAPVDQGAEKKKVAEAEANKVAKKKDAKTPDAAIIAKAEADAATPEGPPKPVGGNEGEAEAKAKEDAASKADMEAIASALPPGFVGRAEKPSGLLLRYNSEKRDWERLEAETPLKHQDRLLSLNPYRSTVELGSSKIELVGETEVWVLSATPNEAGRLSVIQGRVILHGPEARAPFNIQFAKKTVLITPPSQGIVGIERINRRESGSPVASDPFLKVFSPAGEVALEAGDAKETLSGPGTLTYEPRGAWTNPDTKAAPAWVVDAKPTPYDQELGEQFLGFFSDPKRPILTVLVSSLDDDRKDVRRLAISALRAVEGITFVVALLRKPEDPVSRRASIGVLRSFLGQGADASRDLQSQLQNDFGEELSGTVAKLLIGYTAKEARDPATYSRLVEYLSSPEVAVRELAIDNLQSLTGRDELGYDPDQPQGKGLRAWKELDHNHELVPRNAAKPAATEAEPKVEP